jgi:hypothetical protein
VKRNKILYLSKQVQMRSKLKSFSATLQMSHFREYYLLKLVILRQKRKKKIFLAKINFANANKNIICPDYQLIFRYSCSHLFLDEILCAQKFGFSPKFDFQICTKIRFLRREHCILLLVCC